MKKIMRLTKNAFYSTLARGISGTAELKSSRYSCCTTVGNCLKQSRSKRKNTKNKNTKVIQRPSRGQMHVMCCCWGFFWAHVLPDRLGRGRGSASSLP